MNNTIKVILPDGTELEMYLDKVRENHDFTFLSLFGKLTEEESKALENMYRQGE